MTKAMLNVMKNLLDKLQIWLWDREALTRPQKILSLVGRYFYVIGRDLIAGQLTMRAMSLVYTTLLSLVPMLALAFSLFKGLGAHNMLEPVLLEFLKPLGPQARELTANVLGFVENIKVGVLGSLGVALLFYTAVSMIQKVESSFNYIWRIERARPMSQRVGEYLAVLLVGPVLVFASLGVTAAVLNSSVIAKLAEYEPLGTTIFIVGKLIPYVLIIATFTFVYAFIPNTKVKIKAALAGGVLAGAGWQSASLLFASFVAGSASYSAVYSGFAIVILLLIWFYVGWLILLTGCQLAYYVQHPEHLTPQLTIPFLSARTAEMLGLAVLRLVGRRFVAAQAAPAEDEMTRQLNANPDHVHRVVDVLLHHRLLAETGAERTGFMPGRDLDSITVAEAWKLLRRGFDTPRGGGRDESLRASQRVLDELEDEFARRAGTQTLREWLAAD